MNLDVKARGEECGVKSEECRVQSEECKVHSAKCKVQVAELPRRNELQARARIWHCDFAYRPSGEKIRRHSRFRVPASIRVVGGFRTCQA
jgi:hypothetical protein